MSLNCLPLPGAPLEEIFVGALGVVLPKSICLTLALSSSRWWNRRPCFFRLVIFWIRV